MFHWAIWWWCLWCLMTIQSFQTSLNTPSFYTFNTVAHLNVRRWWSCPTLQRCTHGQRITLFISWALLFVWSCHREIRCDAATSSAALPPDSIVLRSRKKRMSLPALGEVCVVSYIIILLNYHGVRIKVQMNGLVLGVSQLLYQLSSIFTLSSSSSLWPSALW